MANASDCSNIVLVLMLVSAVLFPSDASINSPFRSTSDYEIDERPSESQLADRLEIKKGQQEFRPAEVETFTAKRELSQTPESTDTAGKYSSVNSFYGSMWASHWIRREALNKETNLEELNRLQQLSGHYSMPNLEGSKVTWALHERPDPNTVDLLRQGCSGNKTTTTITVTSTVTETSTQTSTVTSTSTVASTVTATSTSTSTTTTTTTTTSTQTDTSTTTTTTTTTTTSTSYIATYLPTTVTSTSTYGTVAYFTIGLKAIPLAAGLAAVACKAAFVHHTEKIEPTETMGYYYDRNTLDKRMMLAKKAPTPVNDHHIVVTDQATVSESYDGYCPDDSVRSNVHHSICHTLLQQSSCPNLLDWLVVDPFTLTPKCTTRLCPGDRVFVGHTGLCHSVGDKSLNLGGGRRLYYTAYGDPISDCPVGQFPFPNARDDCVALFTQGPCPAGHEVAILVSGRLGCEPQSCPGLHNDEEQWAPYANGECFQLGTRGPCPSPSHLYAYDVFERRAVCHDVIDRQSPYYQPPTASSRSNNLLGSSLMSVDILVNDDIDWQGILNDLGLRKPMQGTPYHSSTVKTSSPIEFQPLLNPCRPGTRHGNNFKCTNPLIPTLWTEDGHEPIPPQLVCDQGLAVQATGSCGENNLSASCGPSYIYDNTSGRCVQMKILSQTMP